ncbi:ABC transporter permease [Thiohalorhabdus sp. Cl-TMA]|uniref:Iron export ABC transporter permease subunit FetB n=1 Tax=Thiohalorhabdus methylotrophus TaxID=3242694 RepID=A0ABV4TTQ8_9GAMM
MEGEGPVALTAVDLTVAASLILLNAGISLAMSLGMGRFILVAAGRMIVQLLAVGMVLEWVFGLRHPMAVVGLGLLMAVLAGREAVARQKFRFSGIYPLGWGIMVGSSFMVTAVALAGIVSVDPWFRPQYAIPLLGMILGNTLNGIALGMDRVLTGLRREQDHIELLLALGATRREAIRDLAREAVRVGTTPIINGMSVAGVVSLPGMMTGQILSGTPPVEAVKYQIMIFFLVAAGTALGTVGAVLGSLRRLVDSRGRIRSEALKEKN